MNRVLKLYIFNDGVNDELFLKDDSIALNQFTYSASRMGGAPTITGTIYYGRCLDDDWSENVYTEFNGERYFLAQTPTSSFDNTDERYKHQVTFVSERIALEDVYFFDVVANPSDGDKPVSNSSEVTFFGDIVEFVSRLNASLAQSGLEYSAVIDSGVTSEEKLASFSDVTISEALKEIYNLYKIPYYFEGKVIHIGEAPDTDDTVFKYGSKEALISVAKNNANYKIINRATGVGSEENLPYFYPNISPWGDSVPLYNQQQRDIAVTDWNKISPYGKQAVLKYEVINRLPYNFASNDNWNKVENSRVENFAYADAFNQTLYSFTYYGEILLTAALGYDTLSLDFHPLHSGSKVDYTVELVDLGTGSKQSFKSYSDNKVSIKEGQYKIVIQAYINDIDISSYDLEEEVQSDLYFLFTLTQTGINENWAINGEAVTLEQVGLASSRTPVVGDQISFSEPLNYITPSKNLMPSIYRESLGKERFYNAVDNKYTNSDGEYYIFPHPYVAGKPKEGIIKLEDIKPTIKGMTNASGHRIDMFIDFAFDANDNDDFDEDGNYLHPYFYGKLRKFNGSNGFNLFDHAIESGPMTISMTSGHCGACNFEIGVDKDSQKNVIQVNDRGELIRDKNGDVVRRGVPQEKQNDTINNEVWIALKKDINTFGFIMPNAQSNYRPTIDDTFVITNIALPQGYITAAEKRLEEEIIKYIFENNAEKFTFNVKLSRIFLAEYPDICQKLNENSTVWIEYNNKLYFLYVSSYSYKQTDEALPEITIEVTDTLATGSNTLQRLVGEVNQTVAKAITAVNVASDHKYLSKVADDVIQGNVTLKKQATFGASAVSENYASDPVSGTGWGLTTDTSGNSVLEVDKLTVRKEAHFNELVINQTKFQRGDVIYSNAGCEITNVEEYNDFYRCYYDNKGGDAFSGFEVGDQAICQRYDDKYSDIVGYYWRLVVGVGATYVDLSKTDYDGTALPEVGDDLCQLGNRNNNSRQSAIIVSPSKGGSIVVYSNINGYSLENKNYIGMGVGDDDRAKLYGYGDMFFGDRELKSDFITYQIPEGSDKPKLVINATVEFGSDSKGLSNLSDFQVLENDLNKVKEQVDKEYRIWFVEEFDGAESYVPDDSNQPAVEWTTAELKAEHDQDIFYNRYSGLAWRYDDGAWENITDSSTVEALAKAQEAKEQTKTYNDEVAKHFGYRDYESMIDELEAQETILKGGYINTKLIETDKLIAEKVAVTKGTTLIKIDTDNIFKVSKILGSGVDDNTPVLQLSDKGLDFLDDSGNITAHFTGSEQAFLNIPTVPSKVRLSEKSTTSTQDLILLDFTNNTGTTAEVEVPQINLACRFYADSELQSFEPSGGISYLFTITSGGNNVVSKNDTFEVPESGWNIYDEYETGITYVNGHQDSYQTVYSGDKVQVANEQQLIISIQIIDWTASGVVSSHFAARINGNTNPIGQNISTLLPVSVNNVIQPLLRSDYYGNGFVLAKDVNNYFALAINKSAAGGAQMEFRNEGVGFRIANNTISAWTGETWTPLDWNKILSLLS